MNVNGAVTKKETNQEKNNQTPYITYEVEAAQSIL